MNYGNKLLQRERESNIKHPCLFSMQSYFGNSCITYICTTECQAVKYQEGI